ncbi:TPA: LPXTG cell wall anchor domain-containing protein [Streptococcus suis]|nr:LPXTG cell wall anchor domain-containing protein [Streptococcus suis]
MMKRKERIDRARLHKLARLGIGLVAFTALGGVQHPIGLETGGSTKVYAEESKSITYRIHYFLNDTKENGGLPSYTDIAPYKEGTIIQGETITEIAPQIDGYVLTKETWNSDKDVVTYDKMTAIEAWSDAEYVKSIMFFYDKVESSVVEKPAETPTEQPPQPITFPVRYVSVDYAADKGVVITGVLYETTATVEPGGTVIIENKTFDGYSLDTMEGPWKTEHSYEDVVAAGWSDGIDLRYSANTPTIDNTTDTANSSVDVAFQEASIRLYNLLMTASRLNPEDYTAESYNKYYDSHDEFGLYGTIISVLDEYKEVVNGNIKLEDRWDNGASPKAWLTVVYNANSTVLEQALAGLVAIQQETPSDSSSAGTDEGTTGKTSQTPTDKPVTPPAETPSVEPPATPPADSKPTETSPVTNQSTQNQPAQTGDLGSQTDKKPVSQPAQESQLAQLQVKQATVKPASTSQSQAKSLPATGEVSSVLHLTGLGLLGLAGLVVKRRSGKSS